MLVMLHRGALPMVFNTALCFVLVGAALMLHPSQRRTAPRLRRVLCGAVLLLCLLTMVELLVDRPLGIDHAGIHGWYDYGNTRPGRMAPNTATGFIVAAGTLLAMERVTRKWQAFAIVLLTFCLLAIGLTGLVGYLLAPELLFGWARSARMAVHTAIGMTLIAIGLWLAWSRTEWYRSNRFVREDEKIRILGAGILMVVTVTVGLVGFVLSQQGLERSLESGLENIVRNRVPWFTATVEQTRRHAARGVRLSGIDRAGLAVLAAAPSAADREQLTALGEKLVAGGFRGLTLRNAQHQSILVWGHMEQRPELAASLDAAGAVELVWDGVLMLRLHVPLKDGEQTVGEFVLDEATPVLDTALFNVGRLGTPTEIAACVRRGDALRCFPGSHHTEPYTARRPGAGAAPLPMEHALAGQTGLVYALDYRGVQVVAAHGPLADGLGFVAKQDTMEMYRVIRDSLTTGAPIILIVALLGSVLLYTQLHPLAQQLRASQLAASEKELEAHSIMSAAGDGIVTTDERGRIRSINPAACLLFGEDAERLTCQTLADLMPVPLRRPQLRRLLRHLRASDRHEGHAVELIGQRCEGTHFPLEVSVKQVPLSGKRLFIGVMRDISERKAAEQALKAQAQFDALTGLPNRALFMDRLCTAVLRARRSGDAIALMFIDLDGFKAVNDNLGHQAGDELLVQFAQRLSIAVRKTDTVARLAGDEFTVVLEKLAQVPEDATRLAEKVIAAASSPFVLGQREVSVSASVGVVVYRPRLDEADAAELLRRADEQMYAAKRGGKNGFRIG